MEIIWTTLLAIGLPSAIVGFALRRIETKLDDDRKAREAQEKARKQHERFLVEMLTASAALGKANAIALKNGKCNGETSTALAYLEKVKHEQRDFLVRQGIDHLF